MDELVVGGAEQRVAGVGAEARRSISDCGCSMRKPTAKGLASMNTPACVQHLEGVARAVAERQNDVAGGDFLAARQRHAAHAAACSMCRPVTRLWKRISPPSDSISRAHVLDHADQPEGADVRLGDVEDFLRRAGLDEFGQHLAAEVARVLDLAVELAVGEGAGAAFAELHVRFRVEHVVAPQSPGVLGAFAHRLAALQHDRPEAHLRQDQRGEDAGRAEADDDRALARIGRRRARRSGSWCRASARSCGSSASCLSTAASSARRSTSTV